MSPDDEVCYCYHVSLRKLVNFSRRVRPKFPSQMVECLHAGTGCGWCIPILKKIAEDPDRFRMEGMEKEEYASRRQDYIRTLQPRHEF